MNQENQRKKVLILCLSDPSGDPRPRRILELCTSQGFEVSVLGYPLRQQLSISAYYSLPSLSPRIIQKVLRRLWGMAVAFMMSEEIRVRCEKKRYGLMGVKDALAGKKFDLLIVEDIQLLPLAFELKQGGKILFDAREYYPRQNEGELYFELFEKRRMLQLCCNYLPRCEAVVTVSEGLKRSLLKEFNICAEIFRSVPTYVDVPLHPTLPEKIRMVYHGAANRNRRIEKLIEVAKLLDDRYSLDIILIGNPRYQKELRRKAALSNRITFPTPVPFEEIIPTIRQYDIGFFYCEPTTFNLLHCLPNKFFEYIQARLMIAIGPSPDMAELVNEYGCGVIAEKFSTQSMAQALNDLTVSDIDRAKKQSDKAARELCFEKEHRRVLEIFGQLLK